MYLLNSSTLTERSASASTSRLVRNAKAGDRLYRNDGGHFVDVSAAAGIYGGVEGFGLGVVVSDVNLDGCPDIYVANDFPENDFLYLNNCNGTFTESIAQATGHTSRFSMGVDAADFNNDGRPDIAVLDMLPDSERILKTASTAESYELFNLKLAAGYHYQYARNTLKSGCSPVSRPRTGAGRHYLPISTMMAARTCSSQRAFIVGRTNSITSRPWTAFRRAPSPPPRDWSRRCRTSPTRTTCFTTTAT